VATGNVVSWKADRGFGFIKPDDEGPDVFLHVAELDGVPSSRIRAGVRVEYRLGQGERGPKACGVTVTARRTQAFSDSEEMADCLTAEELAAEIRGFGEKTMDAIVADFTALARKHGWVA